MNSSLADLYVVYVVDDGLENGVEGHSMVMGGMEANVSG